MAARLASSWSRRSSRSAPAPPRGDLAVDIGQRPQLGVDLAERAGDALVGIARRRQISAGLRQSAAQILDGAQEGGGQGRLVGSAGQRLGRRRDPADRVASPRSASPGAPNSRSWIWPWRSASTSLRPSAALLLAQPGVDELVDGAGGVEGLRAGAAAVDDHGRLLGQLARVAFGVDVGDVAGSDAQRVLGDGQPAHRIGQNGVSDIAIFLAATIEVMGITRAVAAIGGRPATAAAIAALARPAASGSRR